MAKIVEPKVEIKPVAWTGEIVLKYQGFVTVTRPDGVKKVMTGEPMGTVPSAEESLKHEIMQRQHDINDAISALNYGGVEGTCKVLGKQ